MTVEKYRPTKLDDALTRITEECSEVIKIVCKAQRFGLNDTHPAKEKRNIELLKEELADVETAAADFFRILSECQP
jgi:NTP pyrophosphatase (non-canonical NTP hydrolase)